jgi:hypothetical protein
LPWQIFSAVLVVPGENGDVEASVIHEMSLEKPRPSDHHVEAPLDPNPGSLSLKFAKTKGPESQLS